MLVAERVADHRSLWVVDSSLMMVSGGQCGDLGQVVGERFPARSRFSLPEGCPRGCGLSRIGVSGADPHLRQPVRLSLFDECSAVFHRFSGDTGSALARYHDVPHTEVGECIVDGGFAIPRSAVTVRSARLCWS